MYIATIDTGTTNTRVTIWDGTKAISISSKEVGVKNTSIDGNNNKLLDAIKTALQGAIEAVGIQEKDIQLILGSGMITSNVGVCEVPHVEAPVSIQKLSANMHSKLIPEISASKPIWFVPGVKNNINVVDMDSCEEMDIMRGEEVETFGLLERLNISGPALIILPGSHSKFVSVNEANEITGCITTLGGEILSVLTRDTILADALEGKFADHIEIEWLLKGAEYCKKLGLNRASFSTRIIDQFTNTTQNQKANFILGVVLENDIKALRKSCLFDINYKTTIIIAGKKVLRDAFKILIKDDAYFGESVYAVQDEYAENLAGYGAIKVATLNGGIA